MTSVTPVTSGAPVFCEDIRNGVSFEFHAQHLSANGSIDGDWRPDSSRVCLGSIDGQRQTLLRDGLGGAYVGWVDDRSGSGDIFLQHFTSSGELAAGWPGGGLAVCRAPRSQYGLDVALDGNGGVLLAWMDFRGGGAGDVYAQHVTAQGTLVTGWSEDGIEVCVHASEQSAPRIAADGAGGAYVIWQDRRNGTLDLFAQHLGASGGPLTGWPQDGAVFAAGPNREVAPAILSDSLGHATVAWRTESDSTGASLWAAHVLQTTTPLENWPPTSVELSSGAREITDPVLAAGGGGSTLLVWGEWRGAASAIRAQRLTGGLTATIGWPAEGRVLTGSSIGHNPPVVLADGSGGALVAWEDLRSADAADIYAQCVLPSGELSGGWNTDGVRVAAGDGLQYGAAIATDGEGGAIVTWSDDASAGLAGFLSMSSSELASHIQLARIETHPGHARLIWRVDAGVASSFTASRRTGTNDWQQLGTYARDDSGHVVVDDRQAPEGERAQYRLTLSHDSQIVNLAPVAVDIPRAPERLVLHRAWLTASHNTIAASIALPRGAPAQLDVLDVTGRRIGNLSLGSLEPGEQTVQFTPQQRLRSGIYFVRVHQGAQARVARIVVIQ